MDEEQAREIEVLWPWNETAWRAAVKPGADESWEGLEAGVRLMWSGVVDAVLDQYDEEFQDRKAGW